MKVTSNGYTLVRPILFIFQKITLNVKVIYKNRVPKKGGFILAGTHKSYIDPFVIGVSTIRTIHYIGKKELCNNKFVGFIVRFMGMIPVDRSVKNPKANNKAVELLKNNGVLCIFPEGTINRSAEKLLPLKYGAVSYAQKSQKPIVPFVIIGKPKFFKYGTKIIMGEPINVACDEDLSNANKRLEKSILELIKESEKHEKKI